MALKTTVEKLKRMLLEISHDLEKADRGNKAAAQRVRTTTIQFAKTAKDYRKESIASGGKKKKTTAKKKTAKKAVKKKVVTKKVAKKAAPKRKAPAKKKAAPKRKTPARKKRK